MIKKSDVMEPLQNSLKTLEKVFIDRTLPAHLISEVYTAIHDLKNLELQLMGKEQAHFESIFATLEKEKFTISPYSENMIFGSLNPNYINLSTPDYTNMETAKILKFEKK